MRKIGQQRNWTADECEYLEENWGHVSLPTMCKKLNRSENGIRIKAQRLGLGAFLDSGGYVTFNQLIQALGITCGSGYKDISWIENRGFPVKKRRVNRCSFKVVYLADFWNWAEQNRSMIDFSKMEEHALGKEPKWVKDQRRIDARKNLKYKATPWTSGEDNRLKALVKQHRYTYLELSKMLGRTSGAIQRRLCDLKIKDRPVKADNHIKWTPGEYNKLAELIRQGYSYDLIAEKLNKSSKAIRGRVYDVYGTERIDAARRMIGQGGWGDGRPQDGTPMPAAPQVAFDF